MKINNYQIRIYSVMLSILLFSYSNVTCSEVEKIDVIKLSKMNLKQLDSLFGKHETYQEDQNNINYIYEINKNGINTIDFWFTGLKKNNITMESIFITFKPKLKNYTKGLQKLGIRSDIPPDVIASGVYRWEEKTKLHGFYSVSLTRQTKNKIENAVILLIKPKY